MHAALLFGITYSAWLFRQVCKSAHLMQLPAVRHSSLLYADAQLTHIRPETLCGFTQQKDDPDDEEDQQLA